MWNESSLNKLYHSAVAAFPNTKKRQYATDTVQVTQLEWLPYIGMRTLFLKAHVQNFTDNGGEYDPVILFKNVKYHTHRQPGLIEIVSSDTHQQYFVDPLNDNVDNVLLRCQCGDFFWRGNWADHLDGSLYGRKRKKYESLGVRPSVNPTNAPMICKHLMKLRENLFRAKVLK